MTFYKNRLWMDGRWYKTVEVAGRVYLIECLTKKS